MVIEAFYLTIGKKQIFCTLIRPIILSSECIIYFAPLFEEKMWAHRVAFNFAKELVQKHNKSVLMFDYYGYGESDGDSEQFTISETLKDVEAIIERMNEKGFQKYILWGVRTGSAVAINSVPVSNKISKVFHWAPIFDLHDYLEKNLRGSIAGQYMLFKKTVAKREEIINDLLQHGKCERDGYVLNFVDSYRFGREFYQETIQFKKRMNTEKNTLPTLMILVYKDEASLVRKKISNSQSEQRSETIKRIHTVEREFWQIGIKYSQRASALYNLTHEWLIENHECTEYKKVG